MAAVVITVESLSRSADGSVLGYQARTAFGHVVRAPAVFDLAQQGAADRAASSDRSQAASTAR